MFRVCCDCKKIIGIKRPLFDFRKTHTYCKKCFKKARIEIMREFAKQQ